MFKIWGNRGFHVTFENGYTVSLTIGGGSYSDNHDDIDLIGKEREKKELTSSTAEIWAWDEKGKPLAEMKNPCGWQTPAQFLGILNTIAAKEASHDRK